MRGAARLLQLACLLLGLAGGVQAHETTRSYVTLNRDGTTVTTNVRLAFRDVEVAVWIDEDLDGQITWAETDRRIEAVSQYVTTKLLLDSGGPCVLTRTDAGVSSTSGVYFLDLVYAATCPDAALPLSVRTQMFLDIDPDHRMFLTARSAGTLTTTLLSADTPSVDLTEDTGGAWSAFVRYFREGVTHLLSGYDHLIFLFVLMLPAVSMVPHNARLAATSVLTAVTGFTLAHALTLTAATTAFLQPPTYMIEMLIALSIIITAIDNVWPFIPAPRAAVAAFFGLIHGFGFATALGGLQLAGGDLAVALVGFNLGIEAAQIGVVLLVMPALYVLSGGRILLWAGSLGAGLFGLWWLWLRAMAAMAS